MHSPASVFVLPLQAVIALATVALTGAATAKSMQAEARHRMIVVSAAESQGLDRCAATDGPCGKALADSLCRAHGRSASVSFGPSDDMTGTILDRKSPRLPPGSFIIDCGK